MKLPFTRKQNVQMVFAAWLLNGFLFLSVWICGDVILNNYGYMRESIDALRIAFGITKGCLSCILAGLLFME